MCGIVGGVAQRNVVPILMEGLRRLEYRGYDSAGLAVISNQQIFRKRALGKVKDWKPYWKATRFQVIPELLIPVGQRTANLAQRMPTPTFAGIKSLWFIMALLKTMNNYGNNKFRMAMSSPRKLIPKSLSMRFMMPCALKVVCLTPSCNP